MTELIPEFLKIQTKTSWLQKVNVLSTYLYICSCPQSDMSHVYNTARRDNRKTTLMTVLKHGAWF